jgi:filamentous hemagglutinin
MNATNAGLRVSISLGNSKSENNVVSTSSTVAGSTIAAGGNVSITATGAGKDSNLTAIGSDITAGGNVLLSADNDVSLLAAENTVSQHSTNKSSGASIGIGFGIGGTSNGFTIDLAVSQARGKADGDDIGYTNTHVKAGNNVTVISGGDTTLKGGVIAANSVVADIGGDLNIESLQDSSKFDSKQSSSGLNASLCIPPFCYGASTVGGSVSKSKVTGDFLSVLEQSGIKAGDGGFQVTVAGNTDLKGGLMSSSQVAVDQGNNVLMTGSLTASDLQNKDEFSASGFSLSGSVSGSLGDQKPPPGKLSEDQQKAAAAGGKPTASAGVGSASGSQSSTTFSGISGGLVVITDQTKQLATGKNAEAAAASVSREVTTETADASTLAKGWDASRLQKDIDSQVAITQEFSKQAPKAIADFADKQIEALVKRGATSEEIEKWKDGGIYRVALHTISGALSGGIGGAAGAATVAESAKLLNELQTSAISQLAGAGMGDEAAKAVVQGLGELMSAGVGMLVGGTTGAASALGTDTNNRQMHWQNYLKASENCRSNTAAAGCGTILKMSGVGSQVLGFMATPSANVAVNTDAQGTVVSYTLLDKISNQPLAIMEPLDFEAFRNAPAGFQALMLRVSPQYSLDMASAMLEAASGNTDKAVVAGMAVITSPEYWRDVALGVGGEIVVGGSLGKSVGANGTANAATSLALKEQLAAENLANIAAQDSRLANAINGSGTKNPNFSIGNGTVAEAEQLGKTWVGDGAKPTSDGSGWISADGTRVYRTPVAKSSEFATTGIQANFEVYRINPVTGVKEKISNGHLNVKKE